VLTTAVVVGKRPSAAQPSEDCPQRGANVLRLIPDLLMSEAQRRVSGGQVLLIATTITRLLRRRAVVAQPIGLHHEPQIGPEEVDAKAVEVFAGEGQRQPRPRREWQEESLEFRVGEPKRATVEQLAQPRNASPPPVSLESNPQSLRTDQIKPIRLVHRPLDPRTVETAGDVNQGEDRIRHGNSEVTDDVIGEQFGSAMDPGLPVTAVGRGPNRNLDWRHTPWLNAPEPGGAAMSQEGTISTSKNRRHPSSAHTDLTPTDRIDPMPYRVQPASNDPMLNRPSTQPKLQELRPPNNPMLLPRNPPNRSGRLLNRAHHGVPKSAVGLSRPF
jgi:hypothetical protein